MLVNTLLGFQEGYEKRMHAELKRERLWPTKKTFKKTQLIPKSFGNQGGKNSLMKVCTQSEWQQVLLLWHVYRIA